ncbi:MAG: hypothetical protein ACM3Q2_04345 [Syntrophothermus sp.]
MSTSGSGPREAKQIRKEISVNGTFSRHS